MERRTGKSTEQGDVLSVDEERQELIRKIAADNKLGERSYYLIPPFLVHYRKALLIPSSIINLIAFIIIRYMDNQITNSVVPYGQVSLQFCFTYDNMVKAIHSWGPIQREMVRNEALFDFVFIFCYLVNLIVLVVYRGNASDSSILVACTVVFGAVFDIVEGFGLLAVFDNPYNFSFSLPTLISICAMLKFVMLGVAVAFIIRPFALEDSPTIKRE